MNVPAEISSTHPTPPSPPPPSNENGPSVSPSTEHGSSASSVPAEPTGPSLDDWKNTWSVPTYLRAPFTFDDLISGLKVIYNATSHWALKADLMTHLIVTKASRTAALAAAKAKIDVERDLRS